MRNDFISGFVSFTSFNTTVSDFEFEPEDIWYFRNRSIFVKQLQN